MPNLQIEIILLEQLDETWAIWFEGLALKKNMDGSTSLSGEIPDQSALHGLLECIRDLNLHLASVQVKPIKIKGN